MNLKKYLEKCIHGWLPKEPHSPNYKPKTNHKPPKITLQIAIVILVMGFVGGLLGAFTSPLGLFSGLGVYVVSVVVIVIGITIVAATIIIRTQQKKEQQRI